MASIPTKRLTFSKEVLDILRDSVEWSEDGKLAKMPQLDRAVYTKVDQALRAMGGAWNRKAGGHIFPADPRPTVDGLIESGALVVERDGFFETPPDVVRAMVHLLSLGGDVPLTGDLLEPSAGKGAIIRIIKEQYPAVRITAIERNRERAAALREEFSGKQVYVKNEDFLDKDYPVDFKYVAMNPPFENMADIDHVMHAFEFLRVGGLFVAIMSAGPFFREDKKAVKFREWLDSHGFAYGPMADDSVRKGIKTYMIYVMKR